MSSALRPCLRPATLPSLPISLSSSTYICQACRHARLLRRPKRPYTFTQLVTLSDGSAFTMRTTSPLPVYRSTRDTRNSPLWNPSSKELLNVEEDEAGRLAGFRARFGTGFDANKETVATTGSTPASSSSSSTPSSTSASSTTTTTTTTTTEKSERKDQTLQPEKDEFEEDDLNLLELISSYGQDSSPSVNSKAPKPKKK